MLCWQASEFRGERRDYELPGEGRFGESGWGKSARESCDPKWELLAGLEGRQSAERERADRSFQSRGGLRGQQPAPPHLPATVQPREV